MSIRNSAIGLVLALMPFLTSCNKSSQSQSEQSGRSEQSESYGFAGNYQKKSASPALNVGLPKGASSDCKILNRSYYTLAFSPEHNEAAWVMWTLTPQMVGAKGSRAPFISDNDLPAENQVEKGDYSNSGYSRGHMMPAADCKFSSEASVQCAFMSNICPQTERLNGGPWNTVEMRCREWTKTEDMLFIVCGPIYNSSNPRKIGATHKLDVPDAFFKVVLSLRPDREKAIGFIFDNTDDPVGMREAACSVRDVEKRTGLTFFPDIDASLAERLKSDFNLKEWKMPKNERRQDKSSYNENFRDRDSHDSHRNNNRHKNKEHRHH